MTETQPIVVAVDGSDAAATAVIWAARAAAARALPLHIVTVVHIPAFYYSEPYLAESFHEEMKETARARLDSAKVLAKRIADEQGPVEITTEQIEGKVVPTLVDLSNRADTIVLGSRGLGEVKGLLVGSVTLGLASHAHCPVAIVRGRTLDGAPPSDGPVVVGVDGSEASVRAVEVAFAEAAARKATLVAVNVWSDVSVQPSLGAVPEDPQWSRIQTGEEVVLAENLAGFQERYPDVVVERVVARDRPVRVLSEYAERAQLIVVGSRGRGGFKGLLLGSTSNALMQTADCPVLIVRPDGEK
ncbi:MULTISPECIES: universal stress protein [Rhodococcus]|jgi:nucleotide-binding universal stress UspA family protein|uniref:Universal stress protein n=1 Tax=Rhodococcus aetherivorans TaxID=191292 RepID=A0A059MVI8_9NOCA|nr:MULTISPECIES: universal stress protein [Rhodococcus]ETT28011.1 UspA domain-containing protein [Rhodococcus rhodochrous ATCC 21198]NCL78068.1 Universal stress protein [Rhodococcus sp. YH1]AKE88967.1 universal stress protein [Rhodococcus aetherivorans]ANZ26341.1 universal stress protein [Rhodococcus sp. WB1]KDE15185.1 universal stress protein [Rhodococcus aetherivorans]